MYTYVLYAPILCCLPSNQWSSCLSSSPIVVAPVVDVEWSANFFLLQKSSVDFMDDADAHGQQRKATSFKMLVVV